MADLIATIAERTTQVLTLTLQDETGQAIPGASLDTCKMSLYDVNTGAYVNARDHVDVKSDVGANGILVLELAPADNQILSASELEAHRVLIEWEYGGGSAKRGSAEVLLRVRNVGKVP